MLHLAELPNIIFPVYRQNLYSCKVSYGCMCLSGEMLAVWNYMEILNKWIKAEIDIGMPFFSGSK